MISYGEFKRNLYFNQFLSFRTLLFKYRLSFVILPAQSYNLIQCTEQLPVVNFG